MWGVEPRAYSGRPPMLRPMRRTGPSDAGRLLWGPQQPICYPDSAAVGKRKNGVCLQASRFRVSCGSLTRDATGGRQGGSRSPTRRRAIGARQSQIIGQFLIEMVVLSLIGGLVGAGLGVTIPLLIEAFADMPTAVTFWSIALSLGISAGVGILFGLYSAYRAASLDPSIALRHE